MQLKCQWIVERILPCMKLTHENNERENNEREKEKEGSTSCV